ncbi:aminotransferase class III-fold pyridoxal phosphate-dependent enzyme [Leuconostoc palmae]
MGSQYTSAEFNIKCQNYGLKHSYPAVEDIRGLGIMAGLTLTKPVNDVVSNLLLDEHIIVLSAGKNTLRLLPPLTIPTSQLLDTLEKIKIYLSK